MRSNLLQSVVERVRAYPGSIADLSRAADVPYSWLAMFARGAIENPGILQIEKLAAHFEAAPKNGKRSRVAA